MSTARASAAIRWILEQTHRPYYQYGLAGYQIITETTIDTAGNTTGKDYIWLNGEPTAQLHACISLPNFSADSYVAVAHHHQLQRLRLFRLTAD